MIDVKDELVKQYFPLIIFIIKKLGLINKIDEYLDSGMIGLTRAINNFDDSLGISLSTFVYHCIKHELLKELKIKNAQKNIPDNMLTSLDLQYDDCSLGDLIADEKVNVEDEVIKIIQTEELYKAIDELKPTYKEIITRLYGINRPISNAKQLAKERGCTTINIHQQKRIALKQLKEKLKGSDLFD